MSVQLRLVCDGGMPGCTSEIAPIHGIARGPQSAGVVLSRMLIEARGKGWTRLRIAGWVCGACATQVVEPLSQRARRRLGSNIHAK